MLQGSRIKLEVKFYDGNGDLADPTAVQVLYQVDSGSITTDVYGTDDTVKDGTGQYSLTLTLSTPGLFKWRWEATGAIVAAVQGSFVVDSSDP